MRDTNLFGPVSLMRLVLPVMRSQGHGRIVNVTSAAAHGAAAYVSAYGGAKHALDAVTAAVDLEVAPFGVRAVSVVPGTYATGANARLALAPVTDAYGDAHLRLVGALNKAFGSRTDLSVVSEAIIGAATAAEPEFITVAGPELDALIGSVIEAKSSFHARLMH